MKKLLFRIYASPLLVVPLLLLIVGMSATRLPTFTLDLSPWMCENPDWEAYQAAQTAFQSELFSVVVIRPRDGDVFSLDSLRLIDTLTSAIGQIDGVARVVSLSTVKHIKGGRGFIQVERLMNASALDGSAAARIKEETAKSRFWERTLLSHDSTMTAINVYAPPHDALSGRPGETARLLNEIETILRTQNQSHEVYQIGRPLLESGARSRLQRRLPAIFALLILVMSGMLWAYSGSLISIALPLCTMSASVVVAGGAMAWMGYAATSLTLVALLLLIALACVRSWRTSLTCFDELLTAPNRQAALRQALQNDGFSRLISSLALASGFAAFAISSRPALKQFGITTAVGVITVVLIDTLLIPAVIRWYPLPNAQRRTARQMFILGISGRIIEWHERYRALPFVGTLLIIGLTAAGITRIAPGIGQLASIPPNALMSQRIATVSRDLAGISTLNITLDTGRPERLKDPDVLRQIDKLHDFLAAQSWCDSSRSLVDYLKRLHQELNGGRPDMHVIPGSRALVSQYLLMLDSMNLTPYASPDYSTANIIVRHHLPPSKELFAAADTLQNYANEHLPLDVRVSVTGYDLASGALNDIELKEEFLAFLISVGSIVLLLSVVFLSVKVSLSAIAPGLMSLGIACGLLGWLRIPLTGETGLLLAATFALTLYHFIYFLVRYQERLMETNDRPQAAGTTLYYEGEAIALSALDLMAGFALLPLSGVPLLRHIGLIGSLATGGMLVVVFLVAPFLLNHVHLITVWDFVRLTLEKSLLQNSLIFKNFRASQVKKVILSGSLRHVKAHDPVMRQGEEGREMYLVLTGKVEVSVQEDGQVNTLGVLQSGELVGEMALIGKHIRSATVVALEDTELLQIDQQSLARVKRSSPRIAAELFFNISAILSERLKGQIHETRP